MLEVDSREAILLKVDARHMADVRAVEAIAADRRFFHWELEFPEAFFDYAQGSKQHIKPLSLDRRGFDCIIGNPPYVRQETLKADKAYLKAAYAPVFDSANDLYVYFMYREIESLNAGGLMSMIVANKWLRAGYGEGIRRYLKWHARPVSVVDFGHAPIFPEADAFPCVPIFGRRPQPAVDVTTGETAEEWSTCAFPRGEYSDDREVFPYIRSHSTRSPTSLLQDNGCSLEDPRLQSLLAKLRAGNRIVKEVVPGGVNRGPGTGLNEAFYLTKNQAEAMVAADPRSGDIIMPLLRGRDMDRWSTAIPEMRIICPPRGTDIRQFPVVQRHLSEVRDRLQPRPRDWAGPSEAWAGRRPGEYAWFELQDNPSVSGHFPI